MLRTDVLPRWHWRDGRTITSREVIELLDTVIERGAPVMANNLAQMLGHMFKFAIHRGTLENSPVQLLIGLAAGRAGASACSAKRSCDPS